MVQIRRVTRPGRRSAFTLLEVLIVVAIIVVLVGLGTVQVFKYLDNAKKDAAKIKATNLGQKAVAYQVRNGAFPESLQVLVQEQLVSQEETVDPWGQPFQYDATGKNNNGTKPDIWAVAPDGSPVGNWGS
jgi:general secretion pathway protein G